VTTTVLAYIPSPSQGVWHIGPVPLRAYALFIIVGIIAALLIGDRRWVARGGEPGVIYDIALWAVPFGLIGGRLYHVITDWRTYFGEDGAGLAGAFRIWDGGLGIWGAVALGGVGAWIGCRQKGIPLPAFGDAIAPGIVLAQAIGRLGNYFNQELYGRPTTLPWGLEVYERRDVNGALDSLNGVSTGQPLIPGVEAVHPTFLYELLWNVLVFAALIWIDRRFKIGHGRLFAMYVAGYCLGRFWVELMRSDTATLIAGIRVNSFTSTFVFIGAVVYIMVAPKGREDPASLAGKPDEADQEEDRVEEFAKELTAVAATTGVVAAAKAAGDVEDEDAKAVGDEDVEEPEAMVPDVEESEAESEEEFEPEADADAAEPDVGLGVVEGEEAVEVQEAAPEVHEAAVEAAGEAEAVAEEVAPEDEAAEAEEPQAEAQDTEEPEAEAEKGEAEDAGPDVGLGVVEGEEAVEAQEAAPEAHAAAVEAADEAEAVAEEVAPEDEAAVEAADEAEAVADEVAPEDEAAEAEEPQAEAQDTEEPEAEAEKGEAEDAGPDVGLGVVEGEEAVEAQEAAPEVHAAAVEAADEAEAVADEVASEDAAETEEPQGEADAKAAQPEEPQAEATADDEYAEDEEPSSEAAAEAGALAEDVAEAPSEDIAEAEAFAAAGEERDAESDDAEPDEPETEDAEAAVEAAEAEPSEEEAAEEEEAVVEEADSAAEEEPTTGVLETKAEPEATSDQAAPVEVAGGRLSRWLRRSR
jgi:prolipoprotein diacylglyceryl transferase